MAAIAANVLRLEAKVMVEPVALLREGRKLLLRQGLNEHCEPIQDVGEGRAFLAVIPEMAITVTIGKDYLDAHEKYRHKFSATPKPASSRDQKVRSDMPETHEEKLSRIERALKPPSSVLIDALFWPFDVCVSLWDRLRARMAAPSRRLGVSDSDAAALAAATKALRNVEFRTLLCGALRSVRSDLGEIQTQLVKTLVPAGVGLSVATSATGGDGIQVAGMAVGIASLALICIIIARAGVAALCETNWNVQ